MALYNAAEQKARALEGATTETLIEEALQIARSRPEIETEDLDPMAIDPYWDRVGTMHGRGGATEFEAARNLVASADPIERTLGCDILGQLGWGEPTFIEGSVDLLITRLADADERVIWSAAGALGHRRSPRAIEPALALVDHANEEIRFGIVGALSNHEDRRATDALIKLSRDADYDVRNWATFGLGSMCEADYPELREALRERLDEEDAEIRSEAMEGLACRKDAGVLPVIIAALESDDVIAGYLSAAKEAADPALLPALMKLQADVPPDEENYWVGMLYDAIAACDPSKRSNS